MTLSIEGFNRFVTSTVAPIATGWSESCRAGFAPAERPCLCTAHKKYSVILLIRPFRKVLQTTLKPARQFWSYLR